MIVAIMQPYFFPYIGYFQLMQAVDVFILYDDAKHIEHGWVNRNRIPIRDKPVWLTMSVKREDHTLPINQRSYLLSDSVEPIKRKLLAAYGKQGSTASEFQTINELLDFEDVNVARFNAHLLQELARHLKIDCEFVLSSDIAGTDGLRGEAKVIELCRRNGATRYINLIGGAALYDQASFDGAGLDLCFLRTTVEPTQLATGSVHLSIIHDLIRHGPTNCRAMLQDYKLLDPDAALLNAT